MYGIWNMEFGMWNVWNLEYGIWNVECMEYGIWNLECFSTYMPTYLPAYLHVYLPAYLPVYMSTCLPACLPTCLPILHAYLPTYLPAYTESSELLKTDSDQCKSLSHLHLLHRELNIAACIAAKATRRCIQLRIPCYLGLFRLRDTPMGSNCAQERP